MGKMSEDGLGITPMQKKIGKSISTTKDQAKRSSMQPVETDNKPNKENLISDSQKDRNIDDMSVKKLISQGKHQGYLTFDDINKYLPDEMLSAENIDDTLMMFDDMGIDIVDEKKESMIKTAPPSKTSKATKTGDTAVADFGAVTDPVKMYLREMGLVTLLSREGEVDIAKKIEAGEQDVLKALLETTMGVEAILELGGYIEMGALRPKHVLRDIDEGDTFIDEVDQIESFLKTICAIREIHQENAQYRERLFNDPLESVEQRKVRRCVTRRNYKIFELMKEWRLEGSVIDRMEQEIRDIIDWFDAMNRMISICAEGLNVPV